MSKFDEETRKLVERLANEYTSLRSLEMEAKSAKEEIGNQLKAILGDETEFHTANAHIIYKVVEKTTIDGRALKQYAPQLAEKFSKVSTSRPLKIA